MTMKLSDMLEDLDKSQETLRFDFSVGPKRKPMAWPGNSRVALWIVVNVESVTLDDAGGNIVSGLGKPQTATYGWRDYGLRVGLWRIVNVLEKYGIVGATAINSSVFTYYPTIGQELKKKKWEFIGHGVSNIWRLNEMDENTEREVIRKTLNDINKHTGRRPAGWLSPGLTESYSTIDLLAENGIRYVCDWCNDDQPYLLRSNSGNLVSVPYTLDLNDVQLFQRRLMTGEEYRQACLDQFHTLYEEGRESGRVMCMSLHPHITGVPYRIKYLDKVLKEITSKTKVWKTTGSEIASWYVSQLSK